MIVESSLTYVWIGHGLMRYLVMFYGHICSIPLVVEVQVFFILFGWLRAGISWFFSVRHWHPWKSGIGRGNFFDMWKFFRLMEIFSTRGIFFDSWNFFRLVEFFSTRGNFFDSWKFFRLVEIFSTREFWRLVGIFETRGNFCDSWECFQQLKKLSQTYLWHIVQCLC